MTTISGLPKTRSLPVAHFIHMGKTAGSALKAALRQVEEPVRYRIVLEPHATHLDHIPEGDWFFFCVRDPINRFESGFLSRQRQGQPRYLVPWRADEAIAFGGFHSPDELASALSADGDRQRAAEEAMRSIEHVRTSYWDWFVEPEYLRKRADHLLWIGRQERLDIRQLACILGIGQLRLPEDPVAAHVTPFPKPPLSVRARENLHRWYAQDYAFLDLCDELFPGER